jgi:hypothetical protein
VSRSRRPRGYPPRRPRRQHALARGCCRDQARSVGQGVPAADDAHVRARPRRHEGRAARDGVALSLAGRRATLHSSASRLREKLRVRSPADGFAVSPRCTSCSRIAACGSCSSPTASTQTRRPEWS